MANEATTVFISWSGERSKQLAEALRELLPDVMPDLAIWMSEHDISAGARWGHALTARLADCRIGILCLTPENLTASWLLFEAGALAKGITGSLVMPYCLGFSADDLEYPLAQFNGASADERGTLRLLRMLNSLRGNPLADNQLDRVFRRWWPDLLKKIAEIPEPDKAFPQFIYDDIEDAEVIEYLEELVRLHNEISKTTRFATKRNMLIRYLANHHMRGYVRTLERAKYPGQILPLPSIPRMEAAMEAIKNSKDEIVAVSMWSTDRWHLSGQLSPGGRSPYADANIEAAQRLNGNVRRVVVVENEAQRDEAASTLRLERDAGVQLRFAVQAVLKKQLDYIWPGGHPIHNALICDSRILTRSTDYNTHDGELTLNPIEIAEEHRRFLNIWRFAGEFGA